MAIRNLELRARAVVEGFWHGLHRSPYHGFSVEFTEYRLYVPGDDLRYLDWKLLARSDREYLKKFEDETNLRCHLLVDNSRSMQFTSLSYTKADYARTLGATLACFLNKQGDATGLLLFDEEIREYLPARNRPGHLRRLMLALERAPEGTSTNLVRPLERIAALTRKRGLLVIISDLMAPIDGVNKELTHLKAAGHEMVVFHTVDPAELDFGFEEAMLYRDMESNRDIYINPQEVRDGYVERFAAHREGIQSTCRELGIDYHLVTTDTRLDLLLLEFLKDRSRRAPLNVRKLQQPRAA
ncbi:MAG TPA: DUF58 domain-containing protein [Verrucomicrobiales bacterium]|nr:DUF58 domain-containing protein [Verrucomicrobiales bacterium]